LSRRIAYSLRAMARNGSDSSSDASPKARVTRESLAQLFGLYRFMRPYRGRLTIGIVMLLGSSALGIFFPLLSGLMINSKTHEAAFHIALLAISILFVQAAMAYFQSLFFNTVGEYALSDLRKTLFGHLAEMPMTFFAQRQVGELTCRMMADLTQLQDAFIMAIPQFLRQTMIMLGSLGMMIWISPRLTGVMVACFPPTIIGAIVIGRSAAAPATRRTTSPRRLT
jgi:ATP-binding cassette subfamily B protein